MKTQVPPTVVQWVLNRSLEKLQLSALELRPDQLMMTDSLSGVGIRISPDVDFGLRQIGTVNTGETALGSQHISGCAGPGEMYDGEQKMWSSALSNAQLQSSQILIGAAHNSMINPS